MEKQTPSAPGFNAEPPPYAAVAPPHSMAPSIQTVPIAMYHPHHQHHQHHLGHYGPQSSVHPTIVTQQPGSTVHVVTSSQLLGPNPKMILCTVCNQTMNSKVIQECSVRTHMLAFCLCLFGCWPCAPCVYCTDCCMNVNHYCSNCNAYQGTFIPHY